MSSVLSTYVDSQAMTVRFPTYFTYAHSLTFCSVVVGIGTLFCEWKRQQEIQAAVRQAAIYGLGFQDQRRALGLPSRSMYGLALCEGILHLLVTTLEDDTMVNTCFMW